MDGVRSERWDEGECDWDCDCDCTSSLGGGGTVRVSRVHAAAVVVMCVSRALFFSAQTTE